MSGRRLDSALVDRGLARSRPHAARLIADRRVTVGGSVVHKASSPVDEKTEVAVQAGDDWASRGAYKLLGALRAFRIDVAGRRAIDAGASTGGFTDVLLRHGAAAVAAVDVGHGQLDPRIAADPRVHVHDRVNLRELSADQAAEIADSIGGKADIVVADLSFISLTLVLPPLARLASDGADLVPMVKPQFEVGRDRLGAQGVVRDPALRAAAVQQVADAARELGWGVVAAVASPLPGPSGNVEYFLHLRRGAMRGSAADRALIDDAVQRGPQ